MIAAAAIVVIGAVVIAFAGPSASGISHATAPAPMFASTPTPTLHPVRAPGPRAVAQPVAPVAHADSTATATARAPDGAADPGAAVGPAPNVDAPSTGEHVAAAAAPAAPAAQRTEAPAAEGRTASTPPAKIRSRVRRTPRRGTWRRVRPIPNNPF
jgi:hypothetical protein